jgi:hypothetical protein
MKGYVESGTYMLGDLAISYEVDFHDGIDSPPCTVEAWVDADFVDPYEIGVPGEKDEKGRTLFRPLADLLIADARSKFDGDWETLTRSDEIYEQKVSDELLR